MLEAKGPELLWVKFRPIFYKSQWHRLARTDLIASSAALGLVATADLAEGEAPPQRIAPAKSINMLNSELAGSDSDGDDLLDELPPPATTGTAGGGGGLEFAEMRHEMNSTKDESMMLADDLEPPPKEPPKESGAGGGCCLIS